MKRAALLLLVLALAGCPHARPLIDYEGEMPPVPVPVETQGPAPAPLPPFPLVLVPTPGLGLYPDLVHNIQAGAARWNIALGWEAFVLSGPGRVVTVDLMDYDQDTKAIGRVNSLTDPRWMTLWPGTRPPDDRGVCLHELGHLLGVTHSTSSEDVMYPRNGFESDLTPNDIERARRAVQARRASS